MKKLSLYVVFVLVLLTKIAHAQDLQFQESQLIAVQHQLIIDQKSNELAKNQLLQLKKNHDHLLSFYKTNGITKSTLKHSQIDIVSAKSTLDGVEMALNSAKEHLSRIQNRIGVLNKEKRRLELLKDEAPDQKNRMSEVEQRLEIANKLMTVVQQRVDTLKLTKNIVEERIDTLINWNQELYSVYKTQLRDKAIESATIKMKQEQANLDIWIAKLSRLNSELEEMTKSSDTSEADIQKINLQIIQATENVELSRLDVYLLSIENDIQTISETIVNNLSIVRLDSLQNLVHKAKHQLNDAKGFIQAKESYLDLKKQEYQSSLAVSDVSQLMMLLTSIQEKYRDQLSRIDKMIAKLNRTQSTIKNLLSQQIATRQELPGFDLHGWQELLRKTVQIPALEVQWVKTTWSQIRLYFQQATDSTKWLVVFGALLIFSTVLGARYLLSRISAHFYKSRERFTTKILYTLVELIRRSVVAIYVFGLLITFSMVSGIQLNIVISLVGIYILFKGLIQTARITLLESESDTGGEDVRLYHELRWIFVFGGILFALLAITHQLPVSYEILALSNRIFMVFVLLIGLLLFHGRTLLPEILDSKFTEKRRYVFHALRILNYLIPIALISNAIIGLFGYVDLAWTIAKMQGIFLLVMAAYLMTRGLIIDLLDYLAEFIIKRSKNGWVWVEAFIKPLDKLVRIFLVIGTIYALISLYELNKNPTFVHFTTAVFNKKLFELGSNVITPIVVIKFIIFIVVLYWVSRWTREFSIRWWYKRFKDLGLRNSLSIFTQYLVVITGVLIGMQLIGMDLTGFAVIAAAFFAGIGFGLRDMANNYFSGMLLLIERPFRKGDIVKVGEFEGEVIHLGMRSTSVRTWDHMEVIVPNADMFSKAFVNWTHQDSMVRSVIAINVDRNDNPHQIRDIILDVLANHPAVLDSPEPAVLMREVNASLVEMEVRYFIIISPERSRVVIRSEVLYAIWDSFKQHGVRPPYQQYEVNLLERRG